MAVNGVSFDLYQGEMLDNGTNGAGKSTLLKAVAELWSLQGHVVRNGSIVALFELAPALTET